MPEPQTSAALAALPPRCPRPPLRPAYFKLVMAPCRPLSARPRARGFPRSVTKAASRTHAPPLRCPKGTTFRSRTLTSCPAGRRPSLRRAMRRGRNHHTQQRTRGSACPRPARMAHPPTYLQRTMRRCCQKSTGHGPIHEQMAHRPICLSNHNPPLPSPRRSARRRLTSSSCCCNSRSRRWCTRKRP